MAATTPVRVDAVSDFPKQASPAPNSGDDRDEDSFAEESTLHLEDDPLINVVLHDTYRIVRVIGEGGMGRVYEAWHTRIKKKRYAIKVLHAEYARNVGILKRFQREAETAACLSHPNAVGVYDVDVVAVGQERPYLVSEYLEGVDLSQWIKQQAPLDPDFVKHLSLQMCDALIEAHDKGVVHRDLKPQNIFLLTDSEGLVPARPVAKVLDFGLSRFVDDADSELTRSGMVMGTPSYMSPEQARGERADHRVDIYGLGAVMFASVTGRPPYKSSTPQATVLAVMNEEAPRPSKLNPNVSPELELIIQKAMARDPNRRYATMQELRDDLEALVVGAGAPRANRPKIDSLVSKRLEAPSLRLQLSLFWLLAFIAGSGATIAAVWSVVLLHAGQWPLSRNATTWLGVVLLAGFAAPLTSAVNRIRRNVWSNTANVAHVLQATRQVTLAALSTYGATGLLLLLFNLSDQLFHQPQLTGTALSTFAGVTLVCFATTACVAAAATWRQHLQAPGGWVDNATSERQERFRRFATGPVLATAAVGFSLLTVFAAGRFANPGVAASEKNTGAQAQHGDSAANATPDAEGDAPSVREPVMNAGDNGPAETPAAPGAVDAGARVESPTELGLASSAALSTALSQGTEGLNALLEQYPNDPGVLRAVAFDHASRSTGLRSAIATLKRLFAASPQAATNDDVQQIILSIARGGSDAKRSAFELMAKDMGTVGPDLLYRLSLSKSTRPQALAYLARPSVRKNFSPALSVAYDLRFSSCARRLPMLPRATQFGDERSIRLLHSLSASSKTGCGPRKSKPCPSKCPKEEAQFIAALEAIKSRLAASGASE